MGKKGTRRGSLAYWHRARAKRLVPRLRCWRGENGLSGFVGYKVGMRDVLMVDDSEQPTKGQEIVVPVTIIEVPPVFVYAVNVLQKTPIGLKQVTQIASANAPKEAKRVLTVAKNVKGFEILGEKKFDELRLVVVTEPSKIGLKKTPEIVEIPLTGTTEKQLETAKSLLGKEVNAGDVFKQGDYIDVIAVTKGKGWQGTVKRFGVALNPRKATAHRRKGGTLGGETQARVFFSVPRPGQMGFHRRTDSNKRILKISSDKLPAFKNYGLVSGAYLMVKGSVPGPCKRMLRLRLSLDKKEAKEPSVLAVHA